MSLQVGDAVLVHINDESRSQRIGVLEYIGYIDSHKRSKLVGINLVESVENGHNGTINGMQHFQAIDGHGIYVRIQNIIKKLDCRQLTLKIQQILLLFKQRMNQYVSALSERDDYIEELKASQRRLKKLLKSKKQTTNSNNNQPNSLHTITELISHIPPPMSKMTSDDLPIPKEISKDKKHNTKGRNKSHPNERIKRKKNCEYTKHSSKKSNVNCDLHSYYSSEDDIDSDDDETSSSDSNITNDSNGHNVSNNIEESTDDDLAWCDDNSYVSSNKKYEAPTPISISTINSRASRHSRSTNKSNKNGYNNGHNNGHNNGVYKLKNKNKNRQKSHSTHNTPNQSPTVNNLTANNMRRMELMSKSISPNHYHHNNNNRNNNIQTVHQTSFSNQSYSPYNDGMYHPNGQNMQQLYDMMVSQQQNINQIPPMQPVTRHQTEPNMHNVTHTKRRSLHKIQPIPELHHNKRVKKQKQQLKLRNRRSNSVDACYFSEVQLKNQVVNLKNSNTQQCKDNNNNNIYNGNYNGDRQYVFQQPPQQFQYHNNSPPSDQIYTVTQPLQDHFSAYF